MLEFCVSLINIFKCDFYGIDIASFEVKKILDGDKISFAGFCVFRFLNFWTLKAFTKKLSSS